MRKAVITGICGQDGWYLAQRLLSLGYSIVGTTHLAEEPKSLEVNGVNLSLVSLDLENNEEVKDFVNTHRPDEFYNLAARASSAQLFDDPVATANVNGVAVARILESISTHSPQSRFCQASSSEVFGRASTSPQDENTPRRPINAYGAAKAFADHLVLAYRVRGIFACSAILYSHESPRRPPHFLVRKVAQGAARISAGLEKSISLGNLEAVRDWGYAPDYVEAMRRMLKCDEPNDYIVATGEIHSVRQVCEVAFSHVGLDYRDHVKTDDRFVREVDSVPLRGNSKKARSLLEWKPTVGFGEMIRQMVDNDRESLALKG